MDKRPILSICIPTFNRAEALNVVLGNYISNPEFDEDVEIVISDNASPDSTKEVVEKYIKLHSNIRYFRNEENIKDANFPLVLSYGEGEYLKLLNDCVYMSNDGMRYMKSALRKNLADKFNVFFTSNYLYTKGAASYIECQNIDEYVQRVSTFVTCNNIFGAWRKDWDAIKDKRRCAQMQLQQDDWTYQLVDNKKKTILYNKDLFNYISVVQNMHRTPYNWFKVHLDNYYKIMMPYIESGKISVSTFRRDREYLFYHFSNELDGIFFHHKDNFFTTEDTLAYLFKYYKNDAYFYKYFIVNYLRLFKEKVRRFIYHIYSTP